MTHSPIDAGTGTGTDSDDAMRAELGAMLPAPAERDLTGDRARTMSAALLREFADPAAAVKPRRRRLVWRVGAPVVVFAVAGATAAAVLIDDSPVRPAFPTQASCTYEYAAAPKLAFAAHIEPGQTPEEACARYWPAIVETARRMNMPGSDGPGAATVPALVTCTWKRGHDLMVMPKPADLGPRDACIALRMGVPDKDATYHGATIEQVRRLAGLVGHSNPGPVCLTVADAHVLAERSLSELGLDDWDIDYTPDPGVDTGLAFVAVDADEGALLIRDRAVPNPACTEGANSR